METLSEKLLPFQDKFEATRKPFVKLSTSAEVGKPWSTKFGGNPYMTNGMTIPCDAEGNYMQFVAQINFAEMPPMQGFPTQGLVQFFTGTDNLVGLKFENQLVQDTFRIVFHQEPVADENQLITDFSFLPVEIDKAVENETFLKFELGSECVPYCDIHFQEYLGEEFFAQFGEEEWDLIDEYGLVHHSNGHKIGGYAFFTQDDPRYDAFKPYSVLLLQIDSDANLGIQWGDMGVCNFFVTPEDLAASDFSKVLYNWDCY